MRRAGNGVLAAIAASTSDPGCATTSNDTSPAPARMCRLLLIVKPLSSETGNPFDIGCSLKTAVRGWRCGGRALRGSRAQGDGCLQCVRAARILARAQESAWHLAQKVCTNAVASHDKRQA